RRRAPAELALGRVGGHRAGDPARHGAGGDRAARHLGLVDPGRRPERRLDGAAGGGRGTALRPARVDAAPGAAARGRAAMRARLRQIGYQGQRLEEVERYLEEWAAVRRKVLPNVLPSVLFLWIAALVLAGRGLSARIAGRRRWPALSRARLTDWRLPDGAIWIFLLGIALLVAELGPWKPTAWTLLIVAGLGFCVQGIAVVESLLL